jgi:hypothetical protein
VPEGPALHGEHPRASWRRVKAAAVAAGPGCEGRGSTRSAALQVRPGGRSQGAGAGAAARQPEAPLPCWGCSVSSESPVFSNFGQQVVPVDRGRTLLCRPGSGTYPGQLGRGGGNRIAALTSVTNGMWDRGWAVRSGRGRSPSPGLVVQPQPQRLGELSWAQEGCFAPAQRRLPMLSRLDPDSSAGGENICMAEGVWVIVVTGMLVNMRLDPQQKGTSVVTATWARYW